MDRKASKQVLPLNSPKKNKDQLSRLPYNYQIFISSREKTGKIFRWMTPKPALPCLGLSQNPKIFLSTAEERANLQIGDPKSRPFCFWVSLKILKIPLLKRRNSKTFRWMTLKISLSLSRFPPKSKSFFPQL